MDIGRIEAGYDELEMRPCCINEIIQQTVEAHAMQIEARYLRLHIDLPNQPVWIQGNARRLRQVMDNLISNAVKYNRPGGWVKLAVSTNGDHVLVRIEDNGIGIPLEDQPRIFERFYRVRNPETEGIDGTVLGLAIVKSIIEKHHGRVWAQSYPGKGSTFGFALSASESAPASADDAAPDNYQPY